MRRTRRTARMAATGRDPSHAEGRRKGPGGRRGSGEGSAGWGHRAPLTRVACRANDPGLRGCGRGRRATHGARGSGWFAARGLPPRAPTCSVHGDVGPAGSRSVVPPAHRSPATASPVGWGGSEVVSWWKGESSGRIRWVADRPADGCGPLRRGAKPVVRGVFQAVPGRRSTRYWGHGPPGTYLDVAPRDLLPSVEGWEIDFLNVLRLTVLPGRTAWPDNCHRSGRLPLLAVNGGCAAGRGPRPTWRPVS